MCCWLNQFYLLSDINFDILRLRFYCCSNGASDGNQHFCAATNEAPLLCRRTVSSGSQNDFLITMMSGMGDEHSITQLGWIRIEKQRNKAMDVANGNSRISSSIWTTQGGFFNIFFAISCYRAHKPCIIFNYHFNNLRSIFYQYWTLGCINDENKHVSHLRYNKPEKKQAAARISTVFGMEPN